MLRAVLDRRVTVLHPASSVQIRIAPRPATREIPAAGSTGSGYAYNEEIQR